jgi:hypothetical protein
MHRRPFSNVFAALSLSSAFRDAGRADKDFESEQCSGQPAAMYIATHYYYMLRIGAVYTQNGNAVCS